MNAPGTVVIDGPGGPDDADSSADVLTGVPMRSRLRRLTRAWDKTPGKLRAARALIVVVLLATFVVSVYSALARVDTVNRIENRTEPLNTDAIEVYRGLADADTTVAGEFLPQAGIDVQGARARYDADLDQAATNLAHAGTLAGKPSLRTERIAEIAHQAVIYSGLVERARTRRELGSPAGEDVRQASEVMRSTILRLSETLQRTESANLDSEYRQARSLPVTAAVFALISLVALALLQLFLFRKTRRVLNVGLLMATVAVAGTAVWWTASLSVSSSHLDAARRHSRAVTDALGEAQIAARQARASELLALVPGAGAPDQNFLDKAELLARREGDDPGAGGALGVARQLARSTKEREAVASAVRETGAWFTAHARIVKAVKDADPGSATVALAIGNSEEGSAAAFNGLDGTLSEAIKANDGVFQSEIRQSNDAIAGFAVGTGLLVLLSAAVAAWGITVRLEEYR